MPSMILLFIVTFVLYLSCEKNENKQKRPGFGRLKKYRLQVTFYLSMFCRRMGPEIVLQRRLGLEEVLSLKRHFL